MLDFKKVIKKLRRVITTKPKGRNSKSRVGNYEGMISFPTEYIGYEVRIEILK